MKLLLFTAIALVSVPFASAQETEKKKTVAAAINHTDYPEAFPHKKGFVISPYKPYNVVEVKHLKPGNLAYDPTTVTKDPKTGKDDFSKAKIFRVPAPAPKQPKVPATAS